jgi:hypothetical protein
MTATSMSPWAVVNDDEPILTTTVDRLTWRRPGSRS